MSKFTRATKEHYTLPEIDRALKNRQLLFTYAESGDVDSINILIDAESALMLAKPTAIQLRTIDLVYRQGCTLVEAGRILNVSTQAVKFNLELIRVKIKKVLDQWKQLDRGDVA